MESAAALDVFLACGACSAKTIEPCKELLFRIVSMLSRMTETRRDLAKETGADYAHDYEHEHETEEKLQ